METLCTLDETYFTPELEDILNSPPYSEDGDLPELKDTLFPWPDNISALPTFQGFSDDSLFTSEIGPEFKELEERQVAQPGNNLIGITQEDNNPLQEPDDDLLEKTIEEDSLIAKVEKDPDNTKVAEELAKANVVIEPVNATNLKEPMNIPVVKEPGKTKKTKFVKKSSVTPVVGDPEAKQVSNQQGATKDSKEQFVGTVSLEISADKVSENRDLTEAIEVFENSGDANALLGKNNDLSQLDGTNVSQPISSLESPQDTIVSKVAKVKNIEEGRWSDKPNDFTTYRCGLCQYIGTQVSFQSHLRNAHDLSAENYQAKHGDLDVFDLVRHRCRFSRCGAIIQYSHDELFAHLEKNHKGLSLRVYNLEFLNVDKCEEEAENETCKEFDGPIAADNDLSLDEITKNRGL